MTNTMLVNKNNKMKESYFKRIELTQTKNIFNEEIQIDKNAYQAFLELESKLGSQKIEVGIIQTYTRLKKQNLPEMTPDHETFLSIDLSIKKDGAFLYSTNEMLNQSQTYQKIHHYLAECGFILRYPKEKEAITGYSYRPWQIRYVGKFVANLIKKENCCLEEYLTNFSKILVINKQKGVTSFDIVHKLTKLFGIKRIGHTGTLDPLAEGVLVVTIGKAVKIAELLTAQYKEYEAGVVLGIMTDTLDITGKILASAPVPEIKNLEEVLTRFKTTYLQEVPIYSAVKVAGKKLYEYAREQKEVELPKKEVTIKEITLLSTDKATFNFKCLVSKGCYIRSLIRDIGYSINNYATMTKLVRTKQGKFDINNAYTLEQIKNNQFKMYNIEEVLDYTKIKLNKEEERKVTSGQKLKNKYNIEDKVIFINENNKLLGIYEKEGEFLKTWKNFV